MSTAPSPQTAEGNSRKDDVQHNLNIVATRVKEAVEQAGESKEVRLVAVSKTKPASDIAAAYEAGHRHFGENIQELVDKAAQLPPDIAWHFIGSLQSNKCKLLATVPNLYVVETIDSQKKADAMNKACANHVEPLRVFLQINTSGEGSKSGMSPQECVSVAEHVIQNCSQLKLCGLMTIGSPDADDGDFNPDFQRLADCKQQVDAKLGTDLELSMGMSDDYELAIRMGSTNVRVGSSIFGARFYPNKQ
ncbi:hypothetical protein HDV00_003831 [Rhizophlyctis rosea]|nr:hypothetical protein HDV00_003831 [Rhizophlyctis rosea]